VQQLGGSVTTKKDKLVQTSVRLRPDLHRRLNEMCEETGRGKGSLIRLAVESNIDEMEAQRKLG